MRNTLRLVPLALSLLWAAAAQAQVAPASGPTAELLAADTRRRVTDEVKRFLEERCPQQCDVGEVSVKVAPRKAPVGAVPGFEELSPATGDAVVERVDVALMLDKRLSNDFRSGLRQVLAKKLDAEGLPNSLHESLLHMPTAQDLPPEKPAVPPWAPGYNPPREPERKAEAAPLEKPLQAVAPTLPPKTLLEGLIEALPFLLGLLLCGGIVWFTLRQHQRLLEDRTVKKIDARAAAAALPTGPSPEEKRELLQKIQAMRERLSNRGLAREVMRDLLASGAPSDAAVAVALLGPSVLDGVRGDPASRPGLEALDDYLATRGPEETPEAKRRVLADLDRRCLRVQVAQGEAQADDPFAYLRDVGAPLFVALLGDEPPEVQAIVLRQAPTALVQAFVEQQPPAARERLVRPLLERAAIPAVEAAAVASAFQEKSARYRLVGRGNGHAEPVGDILQTASAEERHALLSGLGDDPQALTRALGSFVVEDSLGALDGELLAAALTDLDLATAALFLSSLRPSARSRVLAALPTAIARPLAEEAELVPASPARRAAARREALDRIRRAVEERGVDLAAVNRKALGMSEEVPS